MSNSDLLTLTVGVDSREVKDAAKDLDKLADSSENASKETEQLTTKAVALGTVYGQYLKDAIDGAARSTVGFIQKQIQAADELNTLAVKTGIATEKLSAYQHAAALSNVSNGAIDQGMKALAKSMQEGADKFDDYGIAIRDAEGKMLSADIVFENIADRFQRMPDGAEKAALALDLLGRTGNELIPMLNDGSTGLEKMRLEAEMLGTVVTSDLAKQAAEFSDNLDKLELVAKSVGNSIAAFLLPSLKALSDALIIDTSERRQAFEIELANLQEEGVIRTKWQGERIAFLESELVKLREIEKVEQRRAALAGAAALGDIRDARDRFGEVATGKAPKPIKVSGGADTKDRDAAFMRSYDLAMGSVFADEQIAKEQAALAAMLEKQSPAEIALEKEEERQQRLLEAETRGRAERWKAATLDAMTQDEQEVLRFEQRLTRQQELLAAELISQEQFEEARATMIEDYLLRINNEEAKSSEARRKIAEMSAYMQTQYVLGEFTRLSAGAAQSSKKMFEVNKAAAIGQATIATYESATKAYNAMAGIPYVGPALGAAAAAVAIAAGMANVSAIKAQKYGGGGGGAAGAYSAPSANGGSLPSEAPQANPQLAEQQRQVNITIVGEVFDYNTVANKLIPVINEAAGNGVNIQVSQGA